MELPNKIGFCEQVAGFTLTLIIQLANRNVHNKIHANV